EGQSIHQQQQDRTGWSVTEASYKSIATDAQRVVKGTAEGRGRVHEGQICSFGTRSASSTFSQDKELLQPTSSQWGLPASGRTDRETLPLPEEKWNNEADTSGATHLADAPTTAITRPYFQPAVSTDTKTENPTGLSRVQTETSWTDTKITLSITTDLQRSTSGETMKMEKFVTQMDGHTDMQTNQSISSFSVFNSSLPGILTSDSSTSINPHGGAVDQTPENKQAHSDGFYAAFTSISSSKTVKSSIKQLDSTSTDPSLSSPSSSQGFSWAPSPTTRMAEIPTGVGTVEAALLHTAQSDSSESDISSQRDAVKSTDGLDDTDGFHAVTPSTQSQTKSPEKMERLSHSLNSSPIRTQTPGIDTQTSTEGMQKSGTNLYITTNMMQTLFNEDGSFSSTRSAQITKFQTSSSTTTIRQMHTPSFSETLKSPMDSSTPSYGLQKQTGLPDGTQVTFPSSMAESSMDTSSMKTKTTSQSSETFHLFPPSSATVSPNEHFTTENTPSHPVKSDSGDVKGTTSWQWSPSGTMKHNRSGGPTQTFHPSQQNHFGVTSSVLTPSFKGNSTKSPIYYIVPNQPATVRETSFQFTVQVSLKGVCIYALHRTVLWGVFSFIFKVGSFLNPSTWNSIVINNHNQLESLGKCDLNQINLDICPHPLSFKHVFSGLQGDVCNWLLQCPSGYKCVVQPGTTNYSCSSACRYDYCHHHGICTHHPGQLPVCRCLVGDDFWYMGQRCDMKMTRARLIGACLTILLIIVMLIGVLACLAVRRYRAILIQAKVDQTRSSYRRFNHFDELSGRFWLRSWGGSADSLDNPAFMRSDELLHLQALDRPCCYHDDTLSLPSTCPSHGMRINTIYPHSSQYGWRGSGMSMGDGVLDSGKASDLSVCSWPVEPIHWTPFPLLQQLASHRNPAVRMSRPRSYCEGMELVDMGKSWTA
uniref:EGF-like domain-containing protein n=1 Tax=Poecilia reticulata TaxID=8081 RepID=A0A3P9MS53_POERE